MPKPNVVALVMAGGEGSRLELLTERRAKPALPYAGVYRLIDFPLSNCLHSGIEDVWVLQQYRLQSLNDELANGRPVVEVDGDGRLGGFHYKPEEPPTTRVATEVFAFRTGLLLDTLDGLAADGELQDFGHGLLPRLVEAGQAVEHHMAGYRRDVGTVPAYWQAHMDLLDPERPLDLDDPAWPILGRAPHRLPARVERAVLDRGVRVGPEAVVGGPGGDGPALVAEEARVPGGAGVAPGGRFGADRPGEAA